MKYLSYLFTFILIIFIGGGGYYLYNETLANDSLNSSFTNNNSENQKEINSTESNNKIDSTSTENTTNETSTNETTNNTINTNSNSNSTNTINSNNTNSTNSSAKSNTETNTYKETNNSTKNIDTTNSINSTQNNNTSNSSSSNNSNETNEDFNTIIVIEIDTNDNKTDSTTNSSTTTPSTNNNNSLSNENTNTNNNNNDNNNSTNSTDETEIKLEINIDSTTNNNDDKNQNNDKTTDEENQDSDKITNEDKKEEEITLIDGIIKNATGYSAVNNKKYLKETASNKSKSITLLKAGEPFKILSTDIDNTWWKVEYNGKIGYVENAYCFINLPDFIPSITYEVTNADKSIYKSSGYDLPNITGKKLYNTGKVYNERLGKEEYIVPVAYNFAKKIYNAQQEALKEGYSLKIYDAYRPTSVAKDVKNSLASLYKSNSTVKTNINYSYYNGNRYTWGQNWFIAQKLSDHSLSAAIDVTLTKKGSTEDLQMPSNMHELSTKAIKYRYATISQTAVRDDLYASTMNEYAKKLDSIMLNNGMNNLASEWWHFQDKQSYTLLKKVEPSGIDITFDTIVSEKY